MAPATWRHAFRVMGKLFLFTTVLALIVYTVSGLVPLKYQPHDHLLIGFVTAEQLSAHEAAESLEEQTSSPVPQPTTGSAITGTGGLIIAVAPGLAGLISALHIEIALQFALLLFISLSYHLLSIPKVLPRVVSLPSLDPPPRRIPSHFQCVSGLKG